MPRLTPRERFLLIVFSGALSLTHRHARLQADLVAKRAEIQSMQTLLAGADEWDGREIWLNTKQPKLTNPEQAGVQLLDQIKEIARTHEVALESPELGSVESQPFSRSVSVQFTAKCSWANLVKFLHAMQAPERFIVFDTATLQVDPSNASRMVCRFKIAKWYAL